MKLHIAIFSAAILMAPVYAQVGGRAARPKVQRPDGPAWDMIRKSCTACHGIDDYAFHAQDRAAWNKLIADKHRTGNFDVSEADRNLLLDWLASKFGLDTSLSRAPTSLRRSQPFSPAPRPTAL